MTRDGCGGSIFLTFTIWDSRLGSRVFLRFFSIPCFSFVLSPQYIHSFPQKSTYILLWLLSLYLRKVIWPLTDLIFWVLTFASAHQLPRKPKIWWSYSPKPIIQAIPSWIPIFQLQATRIVTRKLFFFKNSMWMSIFRPYPAISCFGKPCDVIGQRSLRPYVWGSKLTTWRLWLDKFPGTCPYCDDMLFDNICY